MDNDDEKSKGKIPLAITVAIITVIGSILVALITKWPFGTEEKTKTNPSIDTPAHVPIPLSNCDKIKLAVNDVSQKFKHFKGDMISDSKYSTRYQSNYVFEDVQTEVEYDKQD